MGEPGEKPNQTFPVEELKKLNSLVVLSDDERRLYLAAMRTKYATIPDALRKIDAYDWTSPFSVRLTEVLEAIKANDPKAKDLRIKLQADFPDYPNT